LLNKHNNLIHDELKSQQQLAKGRASSKKLVNLDIQYQVNPIHNTAQCVQVFSSFLPGTHAAFYPFFSLLNAFFGPFPLL